MAESKQIVLIECSDRVGLVAAITNCFADSGLNMTSNWEFVEPDSSRFFMRAGVEGAVQPDQLRESLLKVLPENAIVTLPGSAKRRMVILATKEAHCLGDLMIRCQYGEMNADVVAVISNHGLLEPLVSGFGIPFHSVPNGDLSRDEHEALILQHISEYEPDIIVMAKYMRILSPEFIAHYENRIINIHHSFLPAFVGANPYRQAYERGVKIIGATAHFATEDLDEGPIIAQDVVPIGRQHGVPEITRAGHNVEKVVLARALNLLFDHRVFVVGNKTVIFD